jgi:uncharacterized protein (DUF1800 family)
MTRFSIAALALTVAACGRPSPSAAPVPDTRPSVLSAAERARHALSRLTFGPRPGDLEAVLAMGLDRWLERQLEPARIPDAAADSILRQLVVHGRSAFEVMAVRPNGYELAINTSRIPDNEVRRSRITGSPIEELADMRAQVKEEDERIARAGRISQLSYAAWQEVVPAMLIRSTQSERQLLEVMTVFWQNHFSVFADKMPHPLALLDYDRAVHAHALGKFRDLLGAVSKTPAMLFYLDNTMSGVDSLHPTAMEAAVEAARRHAPPLGDPMLIPVASHRRSGLNENYARELMELHTLGADGGYTQHDVQEVARCLTGWWINDDYRYTPSFLFRPEQHDAGEKTVLGVRFPAGGGVEEGERVLDILARHPSTSRFVARKLVTYFVSDDPPAALVERAAATFRRTDGDIAEVMRTIVRSREFNSRAAYRAKAKTPFELVASTMRVMNAAPDTTMRTAQLIANLGQRIWGRLTPDGWPDQGAEWLTMGSMLNRFNFAARVGAGQVPGMTIAQWRLHDAILALSHEGQAQKIIDAVLAGDASPTTRRGLIALEPAGRSATKLGDLLAMALASPEFQSR